MTIKNSSKTDERLGGHVACLVNSRCEESHFTLKTPRKRPRFLSDFEGSDPYSCIHALTHQRATQEDRHAHQYTTPAASHPPIKAWSR